MYELPNITPFGFIRKLHGHRGEVVIELVSEELYGSDPVFLFVEIEGIPVPFEVESLRGDLSRLILKLSRVDSEEEASKLRGCRLLIDKDDLPPTFEDWPEEAAPLEGYKVYHPALGFLGKIYDVDDSTENVLLLIIRDKDRKQLILPFVEEWIVSIDDEEQKIIYDYPPELPDMMVFD